MYPTRRRPSTYGLGLLTVAGLALAWAVLDGLFAKDASDAAMRAQVATWGLTDLALFTEARYTRHASQADRHAPLQDHPGALEHFPSGALALPPTHWRSTAQP